jgi:hypothetical protein
MDRIAKEEDDQEEHDEEKENDEEEYVSPKKEDGHTLRWEEWGEKEA